ncbi:MAG: hypothetical protein ACYDG6_04280 [Thermincolia bacterium]
MRRLTMKDLSDKKKRAAKTRIMAKELTSGQKGSKPRSPEETETLTRITVNRVRKAMEKGVWDIGRLKAERRIRFNAEYNGGNQDNK